MGLFETYWLEIVTVWLAAFAIYLEMMARATQEE
jgi:hypothetical protein